VCVTYTILLGLVDMIGMRCIVWRQLSRHVDSHAVCLRTRCGPKFGNGPAGNGAQYAVLL
jgi:hypothetical protein